jgi:hypothetical protein
MIEEGGWKTPKFAQAAKILQDSGTMIAGDGYLWLERTG